MIKKKKNEYTSSKINEDSTIALDGKTPPNALELEKQVLGAILLDNQVYTDVVQMITPSHFYRKANGAIFYAMISLDGKNEPIDTHTVIEELRRMGKIDEIGGVEYILEITESISSSANAKFHARIIYEKYILRDLIHIASQMLEKSFDSSAEPFKILSDASKDILDTSESISKKRVVSVEDSIMGVFEMLGSRRGADKKNMPGVPTGYTLLDDLTLGFQKSELIIVAGRPSHGKTALTLNIARNAALQKYKIAFFSLEMTKNEIITRLISSESRVDAQKLKSGKTSDEEWGRVFQALDRLKIKLFIDDTSEMNVLELRAKARRLKHESDIDMVVVDYLQLLKGEGAYERRDLEVAHVSRSLKALAKELDIPVVAAAQLNRGIEQRGAEKKPQLSDLRESGAIEQDADVVLFIHRPFLIKRPDKNDPTYMEVLRKAELSIGKQRNGPPGNLDLIFLQEYTRFENEGKAPVIDIPQEDSPF
jgi:replicative DNA helicase